MIRSVTVALGLVSLLVSPPCARAFHYVTPTVLQVTPASSIGTPANVRWAGLRYVLFDSDADLLNNGSTGRQVFLFDLQERDLQGVVGLQQLTSAPDGGSRGSSGKRARSIVYDTRPGGSGPRQLFIFERHTGARYPLTQGVADSTNATMDENSRVVVFESAADFFSRGIAGTQVYRIDLHQFDPNCPYPCPLLGNAGLTQVTAKAGTSRNAVTSAAGKHVAFESDADPMNVGAIGTQVYLYDNRSQTLAWLSQGLGVSRHPSISRNGGFVTLEADALGGTQIYLVRRTVPLAQPITAVPSGVSTHPSMSSNAHALAFMSSADPLQQGTVGPEIYSYDLRKNVLHRLTDAPGTTYDPAYASGVFATFLADGDFLGNGTVGTALYLVNLFALGAGDVP